jgi:predicted esterase YcpF (UPF0227 family)
MTSVNKILYAHGLGGGPQSAKAQLLRGYFEPRGVAVETPSLSVPSLEHLSPVAARDYLVGRLKELAGDSLAVVASSFGAYLVLHALAHAADLRPAFLVLLAPVIDPWDSRSALLSEQVEESWRTVGYRSVVDISRGIEVQLHYAFVEELHQMGAGVPAAGLSTLILHGDRDSVVASAQSREFAATSPDVTYRALDDDHALLREPEVWLRCISDFIAAAPDGPAVQRGEL